MNSDKTILRLLIVTQVFTLFAILILPVIVATMGALAGKLLYGVLTASCIALALALRYALVRLGH